MKKEKLDILFEDKNILAVVKKSGYLCIATEKEKEKTLFHEVREYLAKKNQKVFIVHRLDKDTSGIVLFAKNMKTKKVLQDSWDSTTRKYYALVDGKTLEHEILKFHLKENKTFEVYVSNDKKDPLAITEYTKIKSNSKYTLLDIEIKTGKKNQIRASLDYINHPILGDKKYKNKKSPINRLCLHEYYIKFVHPITKKEIELKTDNIFSSLI